MFHHFNKLGQIYTTGYQIHPESYPTLKGCNYSSEKLARKAWKTWTFHYLEYCLILAAPSKTHYEYKAE
ncbi:hypothetical protein [Cyanothece sp. BG0011]|uniref:hypothetical protein n=1 Tax=Cyanothece sp. BG0011 TaxID=2082950 RepID=UPI0013003E9B|nr:hypothetical protein [Cyanothece sp. BG0011]